MPEKIKTAVLSTSDKTGLGELAQHLSQLGVRIYSTGGTLRTLREHQIDAQPVEDLTHFPEMMDGRVKTLHPGVFGGILARRANPEDMATLEKHGLTPIDMVVVNLYPFRQVVANPEAPEAEILENIDIGGPSMIRAAAKSFKDVAVVVDPRDYGAIIDEMIQSGGSLSEATRRRLAMKVFEHTMQYDTAIHDYFRKTTQD